MEQVIHRLKYNRIVASFARLAYTPFTTRLEKIIFTATTGRSGTRTLIDVFNAIPGCFAEHEPYPFMNKEVLTASSYGDTKYAEKIYNYQKSINLRRAAAGYRYYLEANHMFIKTYAEYALRDFGEKMHVIHLVRDPTKVANSIYSLQDFPGTVGGNKWWLDHRAPGNRIQLADLLEHDREFKHPFYKGLWYWYEIETRVKIFQAQCPNVPMHKIRTEDLNDAERIFALLDSLGILYKEKWISDTIGVRQHVRSEQKHTPPLSDDEAARKHRRFRQLLADKGYNIPGSLH